MVVGVGAGQMSRVDSVHMAVAQGRRARRRARCWRRDAFFPFRDNVDEAATAGRDGDRAAGRLDARRRLDRGLRRARPGDGLHRRAALPALSRCGRSDGKTPRHIRHRPQDRKGRAVRARQNRRPKNAPAGPLPSNGPREGPHHEFRQRLPGRVLPARPQRPVPCHRPVPDLRLLVFTERGRCRTSSPSRTCSSAAG